MSLIKICGLSTPETLEAALAAGADMVGFVFFEKSPRHLSYEKAAELGALVQGRARKIALSVDADDARLDAIAASLQPDGLQLHGKESPERVAAIKARYGVPAYKVIHVSTAADLAAADAYRDVADWLLLETKPPKDALHPGGNGVTFDWTLLDHLDRRLPFMLSGGLDPANVAEAIRTGHPDGVDVSSGVEDRPGVKNPDKIRAFVKAARHAYASALASSR
ncbi:N-(5'-phosphoribosyl)anthranilate isomerase [Labrys miyagiensis]|uniref:N-(5'-phosphoribosyl)anthranilate isomerase n=1 Tax=Labrys miyagiensis TaxID=346912 RepID=A0ABQ6CTA2_9HYPH|nr:phosphoribosylanthranilate isomerase [Labrys miyagiensis]GLS23033.1 N-(5'-phosphoribosyl)anthranilate isomerase [Labrys miyagiensis]